MTAAEAYLTALTAFAYSAERPVEVRELGASPEGAPDVWRDARPRARGLPAPGEAPADLPDPFAAGVLAILLGEMVERGEDPAPLGDAMRARLPGDLAAARRFAEVLAQEYGADEPDACPRSAPPVQQRSRTSCPAKSS